MQTFLPYSSFVLSARCLDYRRLGKQRVETWQILQCIEGVSTLSWRNHPAVRMWRNHPLSLAWYGYTVCGEWINRGYVDNMQPRFISYIRKEVKRVDSPDWLFDNRLYVSHREALLMKDYTWYSKFNWTETPKLAYYWPV